MWPLRTQTLVGILLVVFVAACEDEPDPIPETIRPIRTFTVVEAASGQARDFTGVVEAGDSSDLSFQVGGNVEEVLVNQGDSVAAGQVLARLDREPFELDVKAAEANLQQANADLDNNRAEFERQERLYEQGWVARVRYDNALREYRSAASRVSYAIARLNLAERDLGNTELKAPFDGVISVRAIDAFVEVPPGQMVFQIDADGGFEVAFGVPETEISRVYLGMPATVRIPQFANVLNAIVSEVGSAAGAGNVFPVSVVLIDAPSSLRSGMTAGVALTLGNDETGDGYLIPLTAIVGSSEEGAGYVFVYNQETSTVSRTAVQPSESFAGNAVAVTGLQAGDILATAGVNFLVDGQKVRLLEQPSIGG